MGLQFALMTTKAVFSRRLMDRGFIDKTGMTRGSDTTVGQGYGRQDKGQEKQGKSKVTR
jgi:hypothetical protein